VATDKPAYEAGLQDGDTIVAVNGEKTDTWTDVTNAISEYDGDSVNITIVRDGEEMTITSGLYYDETTERNKIGINPYSEHHLFQSVKNGVKSTGAMTVLMYKIIKRLITGEVSVKELSGPVGIVYAVSDSAKAGVIYVIYLGALLSLNLAVMNMLPFPALDGGRLLFLLIRKITGRRVTDEMEGKVHFIGMMLLFALMIYVTWNDVLKFIIPNFS
jgi:regulator of sigma E protease